jgi:hypothetical protein
MKLVSFGTACSVRYQIDKYYRVRNLPSQPTLFFDWLMSSDYSILKILSIPPAELKPMLRPSMFKKIGVKHGNAMLKMSGLDLYSIHDVSADAHPTEMEQLIERYHRRHVRLFTVLAGRERVHCIRKKNCNEQFVKNVYQLLRPYNYLLVLIYPFQSKTQKFIYNKNMKCIRINSLCFKRDRPSTDPDWADGHYDWVSMFSLLDTIY